MQAVGTVLPFLHHDAMYHMMPQAHEHIISFDTYHPNNSHIMLRINQLNPTVMLIITLSALSIAWEIQSSNFQYIIYGPMCQMIYLRQITITANYQ